MDLSYKAIQLNDLDELFEIAAKIWHDHYTSIIGKAQVEYMLNKIYDKKSLEESMQNGQEYFFIINNDVKIGFFSVTKTDVLWLNKLYVNTNLQGKGIGEKVINYISKTIHPNEIKLTVNRQNYKSINFYFKNGFKIEKVEDFDIGSGYWMNDFIMTKKTNQKY